MDEGASGLSSADDGNHVRSGGYVLLSTALAVAGGSVLGSLIVGGGERVGFWLLAGWPLGVLLGWAVFARDQALVAEPLIPVRLDESEPRRWPVAVFGVVSASLFSILLAVFVAEPLLLVAFRSEIDAQLEADAEAARAAALEQISTSATDELARIEVRVDALTAGNVDLVRARDALAAAERVLADATAGEAELRRRLTAERTGVAVGGTSGVAGDGPVTAALEAEIDLAAIATERARANRDTAADALAVVEADDAASSATDAVELAELAERRGEIEAQRTTDLEVARAVVPAGGVLVRVLALEALTHSSPVMFVAVWGARLLLLVIDLQPLLHRLKDSLRPRRPYETALAVLEAQQVASVLAMHTNPQPVRPELEALPPVVRSGRLDPPPVSEHRAGVDATVPLPEFAAFKGASARRSLFPLPVANGSVPGVGGEGA
ncbi:MAG: DUF4407 domain-containing protein [Actinomycetota bacterium]